MKNKLYIPSKIKVGYRNRGDTFTKKLAYVVCYDEKGKLRKELSWNSWRDDKIKPDDFANMPAEGFILNKSITRIPWSSFGSNRTMVRVYDPRGFEFEITAGNLLFILMHTDCNKRELLGKFVHSWDGKDLVLLPEGCDEYKESIEFTKNKAKKVSARDLVVGHTYADKQAEDEYVYIGRFDTATWFAKTVIDQNDAPKEGESAAAWQHHRMYGQRKKFTQLGRKFNKRHVFWKRKSKTFWFPSSVTKLSRVILDEPADDLAELIDLFKNDRVSCVSSPVELEVRPRAIEIDGERLKRHHWYRETLYKQEGDDCFVVQIECNGRVSTIFKIRVYGVFLLDKDGNLGYHTSNSFNKEAIKLIADCQSRLGETMEIKPKIAKSEGFGGLYMKGRNNEFKSIDYGWY